MCNGSEFSSDFLSDLEPSIVGYANLFPDADIESVRTNLIFLKTFETWQALRSEPGGSRLSQSQFVLLRLVFFANDRQMAQSDIARAMGVTGTYVTKLIDGLEERGLIERQVKPDDRRITYATMTEVGEQACLQLLPLAVRGMERLCEDFSQEEKVQFQSLLMKLAKNAAAGVETARGD